MVCDASKETGKFNKIKLVRPLHRRSTRLIGLFKSQPDYLISQKLTSNPLLYLDCICNKSAIVLCFESDLNFIFGIAMHNNQFPEKQQRKPIYHGLSLIISS